MEPDTPTHDRRPGSDGPSQTADAALVDRVPLPDTHHRAAAVATEVRQWLTGAGLLGDELDGFLAQGHIDLVVRAWGDAPRGPNLAAAAKWLVLTWILDDRLDDQWVSRPTTEVRLTASALTDVLNGRPPEHHPNPRALTGRSTRRSLRRTVARDIDAHHHGLADALRWRLPCLP
ncbi:hypothetical protein [Streptomyces sp. NPDC092952]|uniref:hypothetical protein n=1 Tax=Streptomyces sp. NPDC092952 TaxID=3366018 RepID=UPI003826F058